MSSEFEFLKGVPVHKPLWVRKIRLWDKTILLAAMNQGDLYIPVESVCQMFNLSPEVELLRVRSSDGYFVLESALIRMPVENGQETRPVICLSLSALPFFLATVDLTTVHDETARGTLRYFQAHAHGVLAERFQVGSLLEIAEKINGMDEFIYGIQHEDEKTETEPDPF